jgi:hypothetical protein
MPLSVWATEDQIVRYIGEHYGADIAAFLKIPDLRKVIVKAAQEEWAPDLVSTSLRRTPWYRQRSDSMRKIDALKVTDPHSYKALVAQKRAEIHPVMVSLGLSGSQAAAETALRLGWNEATIRQDLAGKLEAQSGATGVAVGSQPDATADQLMALARQEYLTPIDRQTAERWAVRAYRTGEDIEGAFRSYMGTIAGTRFGIDRDSGITPADVMAPARAAIAEQLEQNPEAIDFLDHKYSDVLQVETSDGKFRPMTAHEASTWARSQDEFKTTQKAQDSTATVVEQMAKTFGKVG